MMRDDDDAVVRHYESAREEDRLVGGMAELELLRTREVLRRHLPHPPARIVDVGGGTGVHAAWLLADGYDVHLVDVAPRHVAEALAQFGDRGLTAEVGDARRIDVPDASADAVALLGPLYHLLDRADRVAVLREARRVVRPGGLVAAAAIGRFASRFVGLTRGFLFDADFARIVQRDLASGRHANPDDRPGWFTTAYFHRPDELSDEIAESGLSIVELVGLEGLAGWMPHLATRWANPTDREVILDGLRRVESEPSLLGLSAHLLAIGRRPDGREPSAA